MQNTSDFQTPLQPSGLYFDPLFVGISSMYKLYISCIIPNAVFIDFDDNATNGNVTNLMVVFGFPIWFFCSSH